MERFVAGCFAVALLLGPAVANAEEDPDVDPLADAKPTSTGSTESPDTPKRAKKPTLSGTLYGEFGFVFNLVHVPEATADAGFGVRVAVGYHFSSKLRGHIAYRSLSNENKDQPNSEETYSDLSLGIALALDGKHFNIEGELTRAAIAGSGFDEAGLGGGLYFTAGYPLNEYVKVIGRVGAYVASVEIPSAAPDFRERTPLWGLVGVALVYQGTPWGND